MTIKLRGWLTYAEVAERLNLKPETVRKYVFHKVFERDMLGSFPLISERSVVRFEKHRRKPGNPTFGNKRKKE